MLMLDMYKKSNTYRILERDLMNSKVNHSYMMIIPDKKLANEYAKFFAMQYYCLDNHSICGNCVNCKKILHDNMSDIKFYPKNVKLSVEESRQIVADSMVMPYEVEKKLFVINDFSLATPQSQNALLKVLEEPTKTNMFLLITDSETGVLRTILSRAKKIQEHVVDDTQLAEYIRKELKVEDPTREEQIVALAKGNITLANDLVSNKEFQQLNKDILTVVGGLKNSSDVLKLFNILLKYKDSFMQVLDIMLQTFHDIKVAIATGNMPARLKGNENIVANYKPEAITHITKIILECKNRIKFNCTIVAVVDYLLFGILEAKFLCR